MKFVLFIAVLFLFGCEQEGSKLDKEFDRSGRGQKITVMVYDNLSDMKVSKKEFDGSGGVGLLGWARWSNIESSGCTIHVVKLKHKDDNDQMEVWGHELAHCVYGSYHKE